MNDRNEKAINEENPKVRKEYSSPVMICYGGIRDLTRAGGTGRSETNSSIECRDSTYKANPACLK